MCECCFCYADRINEMCEEFIFASQIYNEDILKTNSIPKMMKKLF